jgi:hypothetical protein
MACITDKWIAAIEKLKRSIRIEKPQQVRFHWRSVEKDGGVDNIPENVNQDNVSLDNSESGHDEIVIMIDGVDFRKKVFSLLGSLKSSEYCECRAMHYMIDHIREDVFVNIIVPIIYFVATHTTQALEIHGDSLLKNLLAMLPTRFNSNVAPPRLCRKGISIDSPMDFQGIS